MAQPIDLYNFDRLVKDLKNLSPKLAKDFQRNLSKAVQPVRDEARRLVPIDNPVRNWRQTEPTYTSNSWVNDFEHRGRDAANRWTWRPIDVRRGIKTTRTRIKTGRNNTLFAEQVTALAVINSTPGGVIYELTGAGTNASRRRTKRVSRNPDAGQDFELAMNYRGKPKRLLYKAARTHGQRALDEIEKVLDQGLYRFVRKG
jgi:hypothetical protein